MNHLVPSLLLAALAIPGMALELEFDTMADKILYRPGDTGNYRVKVIARDGKYQGELRIVQQQGFAPEVELYRQPVALSQDWVTVEVPFQVGTEIGGRSLAAIVTVDGAVRGSSDGVAVTDGTQPQRWGNLIFEGGPMADVWEKDEAAIRAENLRMQREVARNTRATVFELAFWAEDDFAKLVPTRPQWRSGQTRVIMDLRWLRAWIDASHAVGGAALPYINTWIFGPTGFDLALDHPDWFSYDLTWYGGQYDVRSLSVWESSESLNPRGPYAENREHSWPGGLHSLAPLISKPEVAAYHTAQVVAMLKAFPWDGVRYDNNGWKLYRNTDAFGGRAYPEGADPGAVGGKLVRDFRAAIEAVRPGAIYGNNGAGLNTRNALDIDQEQAGAERGAIVMEESFNNHMRNTPWAELTTHLSEGVAFIRGKGSFAHIIGPLFTGNVRVNNPVDVRFLIAATHAAGGWLCSSGGGPDTLVTGSYLAFGVRWGEVFADPRQQVPAKAEDVVTVTAPRPLFWRDYVRTVDLGGGRQRLFVHLLNPPVAPTFNATVADQAPGERAAGMPAYDHAKWAPPPLIQRDVQVAFVLPKGFQPEAAYALSPDGVPGAGITTLKPVVAGRTATVTVPRLDLWTCVVLEGSSK